MEALIGAGLLDYVKVTHFYLNAKTVLVLVFDHVFRYDILMCNQCSCLIMRSKHCGAEAKPAREHIDFQNVCGPLVVVALSWAAIYIGRSYP